MRKVLPVVFVSFFVLSVMGVFLYQAEPGMADEELGVVINEFVPNPSGPETTDEWIELYNNSTEEVDLTGYVLDDIDGGSSPYTLSGSIAASDFLLLYRSETGIALNNTGDDVRLINALDEIVDTVSYTSIPEDNSYARIPNGVGDWQITEATTPGSVNTNGQEPTPTATPTAEPTPTETPTPTPTTEPTPTPTTEPTPTSEPSPTPTVEPTPTDVPVPSPTMEPTPEPTPAPPGHSFRILNVSCQRQYVAHRFFGRTIYFPYILCSRI